MEIYFHKLKSLWDEYAALEPPVKCVCGAHKEQEDRIQRKQLVQFLMGLHESYSAARGQILMMNPLPTVSHAYSLIKQEEKQRMGYVSQQPSAGTSFMVNKKKSARPAQLSHSGSGVLGSNPTQSDAFGVSQSTAKPLIKCTYCHGENHDWDHCFKLHGYPKRKKKKGAPGQLQQGFRPLVKAMQVGTEADLSTTSAVHQLQAQVNQMSQMMSMMMQ